MTGRRTPDEIDGRLEEVRRRLRDRHAGIEPDAQFAARVVARLPRNAAWSIDWAALRVLPVSIAVAIVLMIAVVTTERTSDRTTASAAVSATSQSGTDPLEWLLEGGEERR